MLYLSCQNCSKELSKIQLRNKNKFCSQSCAAKYSNTRRESLATRINTDCHHCGEGFLSHPSENRKYCSTRCHGLANRKERSIDEIRASRAAAQSKWRAKGYRRIHPSANPDKIREIYQNRPEGYEVDHIIPLSRGGLHHEDNLQYLTIAENRAKKNKLPSEL